MLLAILPMGGSVLPSNLSKQPRLVLLLNVVQCPFSDSSFPRRDSPSETCSNPWTSSCGINFHKRGDGYQRNHFHGWLWVLWRSCDLASIRFSKH